MTSDPSGNVPINISDDNPWPGLATFTEDQSSLFHGRDAEIRDLTRRAERNPLTVLFGQSGLGKSSLLQAGVFPRLRASSYWPIYIRLDHGPGAPNPTEQVKSLIQSDTSRAGKWTKPGSAKPGESLWEFFHHRDDRLISAAGRTIVPVLVFDQFEELFTLGAGAGAERARAVAFMSELAELVENRPSEQLVARLEESSAEMEIFDFSRTDYRVVISLREDFLPHLEGLKTIMPALMENRMRLARMTGSQALEAVVRPGGTLVTEDVARAIVEFVAGARGGSVERLAELDVEPPLLSVICRELNERRRALGQTQITADLVSGNRREILHDFYERSVADLPAPVRAFIEDHLLTKSGFRDNLALETALEFAGVTRPLIDTLVARRLLRIEDRLGVQRVELTHDVLAEVIRAARDERQQRLVLAAAARAARRQRVIIGGLAAAVVALLIGASFGIRAQRRAEQAARDEAAQSSHTDFIFGSQLLEQSKVSEGLGYLVRAARSDPENSSIAPRLLSALAYRGFAIPTGVAMPHSSPLETTFYIGDGTRLIDFGQDSPVRVWEGQTGKNLLTINAGKLFRWGIDATRDGQRLATAAADGVSIWDLATGRKLLGPLIHTHAAHGVTFSPDGRWLATSGVDIVTDLWDVNTGELKCSLPLPHHSSDVSFSPDSRHLFANAYSATEWQIWQIPEGVPAFPMRTSGVNLLHGHFSPDGRLVLITDNDGAQLWDTATGKAVGPRLAHLGPCYGGAFTHDGKSVVTTSDDGTARVWAVPSGKLQFTLPHGSRVGFPFITPDDHYVATRSQDGMARVWDLRTGRLALEPIRTGDVQSIDLAPDGHELLTTGTDNVVRRWRIESGAAAPLLFAPVPDRLRAQRTLSGGSEAWLIFADHLELIDVLNGRPTAAPRKFPVRIKTGSLSANGQTMLVTIGSNDKELWQFNGAEIVRHPLGNFPVTRSSFSSDSSRLAINGPSDVVRVWDCRSGALVIGPLENSRLPTFGTALSHDGQRLVIYRQGETSAHLLDLVSGKAVGEPLELGSPLSGMSFSPDGRLIAVADQGSTVRFWDAVSARPVGPTLRHREFARGVVFSHDGRRLLTFTPLHARVWDVATGAPLTEPILAGNDLFNGVFSDNDTMFGTRSRTSGEIRVWDSESGEPIAEPLPSAAGGTVASFGFLGADRFMAIASSNGGFSVWPIAAKSGQRRIPDWLPRLAEVVAAGEIDRRGVFRDKVVDAMAFDEIRKTLAALPDDAPYVTWGRWFLADRATRPIAPGFTLTPAEAEKLAVQLIPSSAATP